MKIGIISDTHNKYERAKIALEKLLLDGAEFIVHAGDIGEVQTLELLKNCGKRYIAVYGNNDGGWRGTFRRNSSSNKTA